jgi:hypothetical protein
MRMSNTQWRIGTGATLIQDDKMTAWAKFQLAAVCMTLKASAEKLSWSKNPLPHPLPRVLISLSSLALLAPFRLLQL